MRKERQSHRAERARVKRLTGSTTEFDRKFIADSFGPPTATARPRRQRAERKRGRPRQGSGMRVPSERKKRGKEEGTREDGGSGSSFLLTQE